MNNSLDSLNSYLKAMNYTDQRTQTVKLTYPIITISRQHGARGKIIAEKAAALLSAEGADGMPWLVVDRSLARVVADNYHLSEEITRILSEEQVGSIEARALDFLRADGSKKEAVGDMVTTILRLAEVGHVIFVGRGANVVTAHHAKAYHVHIIGSYDQRVREVMDTTQQGQRQAELEVRSVDRDRTKFAEIEFHDDVEEPLHYHLTINTDRVGDTKAARMIADLVLTPCADPDPREPLPSRCSVPYQNDIGNFIYA